MLLNLKTLINDFLNLLIPNCCIYCEEVIDDRNKILCEKCFQSIPRTYHVNTPKFNDLYNYLYRLVDVEYAFSMFYFNTDTPIRILIHYLKYKKHKEVGIFLGEMYGREILNNTKIKNEFDVIIPIPLHKKRFKERGYNQSEMFAIGLSKILNIPVNTTNVIRIKNTLSQTQKESYDRKFDMKDAFAVINPADLNKKHILLVDDLITTGSTIVSCAREIKKNCKCKISICSIAKTR